MKELLLAFKEVLVRAEMFTHHRVTMEALSVRERMSEILSRLTADKFTEFASLFTPEEGRLGVVVTFLAILELVKESLVELIQTEPYEPIHVKVAESCH
jgi:segregation and condensation protein A